MRRRAPPRERACAGCGRRGGSRPFRRSRPSRVAKASRATSGRQPRSTARVRRFPGPRRHRARQRLSALVCWSTTTMPSWFSTPFSLPQPPMFVVVARRIPLGGVVVDTAPRHGTAWHARALRGTSSAPGPLRLRRRAPDAGPDATGRVPRGRRPRPARRDRQRSASVRSRLQAGPVACTVLTAKRRNVTAPRHSHRATPFVCMLPRRRRA